MEIFKCPKRAYAQNCFECNISVSRLKDNAMIGYYQLQLYNVSGISADHF